MANLLRSWGGPTGWTTVKMLRDRNSDGFVWSKVAVAFEAFNAANIANYGTDAPELGATGRYAAADPAEAVAGKFLMIRAAGANLTVADLLTGIFWEEEVGAGAVSADPLTNLVPGSYADGTAGEALGFIEDIRAKTDFLTVGGSVTVVSPVSSSGDVQIVSGDDYSAADGRALEWTNAAGDWPDLAGATITLSVADVLVAGSVVTPSGPGQKVRAEPTAMQTAAIPVGPRPYDVSAALASGHVVELVRGLFKVLARP